MVFPGNGEIFVNSKPISTYFHSASDRLNVTSPLLVTDTEREFTVLLDVKSGGESGQSDACRLALAKAIQKYDPRYKYLLNPYRLNVGDSRRRERKHPGRKRARKLKTWRRR